MNADQTGPPSSHHVSLATSNTALLVNPSNAQDTMKQPVKDQLKYSPDLKPVREEQLQYPPDLKPVKAQPKQEPECDGMLASILAMDQDERSDRVPVLELVTIPEQSMVAVKPRQRERCKCGSRTHQRTSHKDCPLRPGLQRSEQRLLVQEEVSRPSVSLLSAFERATMHESSVKQKSKRVSQFEHFFSN